MSMITIEVDIDANANITVIPNPAVVGNGDQVFWHVRTNASEGEKFTISLPGGSKSPFGNELTTSVTVSATPCLGGGSTVKEWPDGVDSYSYDLSVHGSPELSSLKATLLRCKKVYPKVKVGKTPIVENNYIFGQNIDDRFHIVNNYQLGDVKEGSSLIGGAHSPLAITRSNVKLEDCKEYRVWRNTTGGKLDRTIGVYPTSDSFPNDSIVTVFVALDDHTGEPNNTHNPTIIKNTGDSVAKTVPKDFAVFVHYKRHGSPLTSTNADISEEA